jgi:hypothetical protein
MLCHLLSAAGHNAGRFLLPNGKEAAEGKPQNE